MQGSRELPCGQPRACGRGGAFGVPPFSQIGIDKAFEHAEFLGACLLIHTPQPRRAVRDARSQELLGSKLEDPIMGDNADEYKLGSPGEPVNARTTERFSLTAVTSAKSLRPWTEDQKWDGKASGKKSWIDGVTRDLRDYPEMAAKFDGFLQDYTIDNIAAMSHAFAVAKKKQALMQDGVDSVTIVDNWDKTMYAVDGGKRAWHPGRCHRRGLGPGIPCTQST